jgi:hypothetical protein
MRFSCVELGIRLKFGREIALGVNGFDGALGDAGSAIDAIFGMNDDLVIHFVKAGDRADFNAVSELAVHTFASDDMCHNKIPRSIILLGPRLVRLRTICKPIFAHVLVKFGGAWVKARCRAAAANFRDRCDVMRKPKGKDHWFLKM